MDGGDPWTYPSIGLKKRDAFAAEMDAANCAAPPVHHWMFITSSI